MIFLEQEQNRNIMEKVVFLDRDGTINKEIGYLYRIEDFQFIKGAINAIQILNQHNYRVVIVSNQAGVARGYYTEEDIRILHRYIQEELKKKGAWIDDFCYCPYHVDGVVTEYTYDSEYRKPGTGMLEAIGTKYSVDKSKSWMIGDTRIDIETGKKYGIRTILVLTGYGQATYEKGTCKCDFFAPNILEAVTMLIEKDK